MSQLQKLLDEKWPLHGDLSDIDRWSIEMYRRIFTEGYNAAIQWIEPVPYLLNDAARVLCIYAEEKCRMSTLTPKLRRWSNKIASQIKPQING